MAERMALCPVVQGVEFTVDDGGVPVRGLILRDALEAFFDAGESPQSWLQAYVAHAAEIEAAAVLRHRRARVPSIVVLRASCPDDFGLIPAPL